MMRSLLAVLVFPLWVLAAPPEVKFPTPEVKAEKSTFVVLKAEVKNGKGATKYKVPTDGLSFIPPALLADSSTLVFMPTKDGVYEVWAWAGNEEGASELAVVKVIVGTGSPIIAPPPVKPDDPKDPPAGGKWYFLMVRSDGPVADKKVIDCVGLAAWDEIRKDGHQMKDVTRTEIGGILKQSVDEDAAAYKKRLDGYVGRLVVLRVSLDGKSSSFAGDKPLPSDNAAVKELVK